MDINLQSTFVLMTAYFNDTRLERRKIILKPSLTFSMFDKMIKEVFKEFWQCYHVTTYKYYDGKDMLTHIKSDCDLQNLKLRILESKEDGRIDLRLQGNISSEGTSITILKEGYSSPTSWVCNLFGYVNDRLIEKRKIVMEQEDDYADFEKRIVHDLFPDIWKQEPTGFKILYKDDGHVLRISTPTDYYVYKAHLKKKNIPEGNIQISFKVSSTPADIAREDYERQIAFYTGTLTFTVSVFVNEKPIEIRKVQIRQSDGYIELRDSVLYLLTGMWNIEKTEDISFLYRMDNDIFMMSSVYEFQAYKCLLMQRLAIEDCLQMKVRISEDDLFIKSLKTNCCNRYKLVSYPPLIINITVLLQNCVVDSRSLSIDDITTLEEFHRHVGMLFPSLSSDDGELIKQLFYIDHNKQYIKITNDFEVIICKQHLRQKYNKVNQFFLECFYSSES